LLVHAVIFGKRGLPRSGELANRWRPSRINFGHRAGTIRSTVLGRQRHRPAGPAGPGRRSRVRRRPRRDKRQAASWMAGWAPITTADLQRPAGFRRAGARNRGEVVIGARMLDHGGCGRRGWRKRAKEGVAAAGRRIARQDHAGGDVGGGLFAFEEARPTGKAASGVSSVTTSWTRPAGDLHRFLPVRRIASWMRGTISLMADWPRGGPRSGARLLSRLPATLSERADDRVRRSGPGLRRPPRERPRASNSRSTGFAHADQKRLPFPGWPERGRMDCASLMMSLLAAARRGAAGLRRPSGYREKMRRGPYSRRVSCRFHSAGQPARRRSRRRIFGLRWPVTRKPSPPISSHRLLHLARDPGRRCADEMRKSPGRSAWSRQSRRVALGAGILEGAPARSACRLVLISGHRRVELELREVDARQERHGSQGRVSRCLARMGRQHLLGVLDFVGGFSPPVGTQVNIRLDLRGGREPRAVACASHVVAIAFSCPRPFHSTAGEHDLGIAAGELAGRAASPPRRHEDGPGPAASAAH